MQDINVKGFFTLSDLEITIPEKLLTFMYLNELSMEKLLCQMTDTKFVKQVPANILKIYNEFLAEAEKEIGIRIAETYNSLNQIESNPTSFIAQMVDANLITD